MKKLMIISFLFVLIIDIGSISACTGFTAADENLVLVGNNEDLSLLADPQLRIIPPSDSSYGRVVFYCKWPFPFDTGRYSAFGGLNDQGLFFDIYSTPIQDVGNPYNKPTYNNDIFAYCIRTCATVNEVVDVFNSYYIPYMDDIQGFFVDRSGNSVIIEGNNLIYKEREYQVVTNYLQSHPELGGYPCWRYDIATSMLEDIDKISHDYFKDICEAVHVENIYLQDNFILDTIYSNICDLNQGVMFIYFFHDYNHSIEIRLPDVFEIGYQTYDLPSLFNNNSNHNPYNPENLTGSTSGRRNNEYSYTAIGTDEDNDLLFYYFDWGDGTNSGWIGYYESGEVCSTSHVWNEEGVFEVIVKTRDLFGFESDWSDPLPVTISKNRSISYFNLMRLYDILRLKVPYLNLISCSKSGEYRTEVVG